MANKTSIRSGASAIPEESISHLDIDIVYQSGVIDPTTHWLPTEQNPKDRSVNLAIGRGYFVKTGMTYHGYSTAVVNVALTANSSGNPRIDAIVAYIDLAASAGTDATNVLKFAAVAGTAASSPSAPDAAAIASAIGAGNPYIVIANVACANGYTQIANANITDLRPSAYVKIPAGVYQTLLIDASVKTSKMSKITLTDGATINIDCSLGQYFEVTIAGNRTINFTNYQIGQTIYLDVKQDATGSRLLTFGADVHWPYDVAPTLTTTANKVDALAFKCYDTSKLRGFVGGTGYTN